jgi:uncharacterized membrane protein YedE/YeeE
VTEFTPISALIGGALIGFSAVLLMLFTGRIAGISGIFGGCLVGSAADRDWRLAFVAGLIAAPILGALVNVPLPLSQMPDNWFVIAVAGLLVGFGTRFGGGCTSGHGVCGIARLSPRSITATAVFMAVAFVVVFLVRHVFGS